MLKSQTRRAIRLPLHRDYLDLIFNSQLCLAVQLALGVHSFFIFLAKSVCFHLRPRLQSSVLAKFRSTKVL